MALGKKVTLTIDGYTIKLSSKIKFYQNDQIHLIFELIENTIVIKDGVASRAILPFSKISPSTLVSIPSSMSLPVNLISLVEASIKIHSKIGIVVLEGTAFKTILIPFKRAAFWNVSFITVDNFLSVWMKFRRYK